MGAKDFNPVQKQSELVLGHRRQAINEVKIASFLHDKCKKPGQKLRLCQNLTNRTPAWNEYPLAKRKINRKNCAFLL
jgi:hypothetical protein